MLTFPIPSNPPIFKAIAGKVLMVSYFLILFVFISKSLVLAFPGNTSFLTGNHHSIAQFGSPRHSSAEPLTPALSLGGRGRFRFSEVRSEFNSNPLLVVTPSPFSSVQPRIKLPEEPEEFDDREVEAYYDWRNDMFFRKFDLTGKGTVDYMTARRTYKVWLDDFGTPVVITVADPLFYWIDLNGNGEFEQDKGEMWSDPYEDGLTGNEKPYDSSDLQTPPSAIPSWPPPDHLTPKFPPCDPRFGC